MKFDTRWLREQLNPMSARHRAAFAAYCAQRMIPNYERFHAVSGWGDPPVLKEALDYVWSVLGSASAADPALLESHESACDAATPDMDEFGQLDFASPALDAGVAVIGALRCVGSGEVEPAVDAATAARDSVDMYVQELEALDPDAPDLEETIVDHPLYKGEMEQQKRVLADLAKSAALTAAFVARLRQEALHSPPLLGSDG